VPLWQKEIIAKCLRAYKPVIVATQMLDSMIRNLRPTRAEVSDVAGAVVDHADGLMLSGETAFGKYPVAACQSMADIIANIEKSPYDNIEDVPLHKGALEEEALAHAAWSLALEVKAKAIVATTISGRTARMIARFRPEVPIVVTCEDQQTQRQLVLSWGIVPFVLPRFKSVDKLIQAAVEQVKKSHLARPGDKIVIISGQPAGQAGANLVKVHTVL
jgi:pyruvate kinase